ncbi:MAG: dihydrofolate reductase [Pseudomonadota bacterium]
MIRISLIAAVSKNGVIGVDGDLPWRISDDLKHFKKLTLGKPLITGRKNFVSIGRPLPGRDTVIVTRAQDYSVDGAIVVTDLDAAFSAARECAQRRGVDEIMVMGGGEIYQQTIGLADRIYLTRVDVEIDGDVFFPDIDSAQWRETVIGSAAESERNDYACEFVILDRVG